jgi:RNA polymerase sigma factor (sigma-70 family)
MQVKRKEYRVTITVKNDLLLSAMEEAGFKNASRLAKACGLQPTIVGDFISMKMSAINEKGELREMALRLCTTLNKMPEDLFPDAAMYGELETNSVCISLDEVEIGSLFSAGADSLIEQDDVKIALYRMIGNLSQKEKQVIDLRYGLTGPTHLYHEIGEKLSVSIEWVRQIEHKALRKMRWKDTQATAGLTEALEHSN